MTVHHILLYYGDVVRILPNARVPTDGIVIAGDSAVDEWMICGESLPVRKAIGSSVLAGTTNTEGILDIQVSHLVHNNSLSTIVSLVQATQGPALPYRTWRKGSHRSYYRLHLSLRSPPLSFGY